MIGHITGTVIEKRGRSITLDVSGIGYTVSVPTDTLLVAKEGEGLSLYTHLAVREDALELYGFSNSDERMLFEQLISVSGIGPKSALGILSLSSAEQVRRAIREGDATSLTKVSGVGKKSAEKIILELRERVGQGEEGSTLTGADADVLDALRALGYGLSESREALKRAVGKDTGDRIKEALRYLSSHHA